MQKILPRVNKGIIIIIIVVVAIDIIVIVIVVGLSPRNCETDDMSRNF